MIVFDVDATLVAADCRTTIFFESNDSNFLHSKLDGEYLFFSRKFFLIKTFSIALKWLVWHGAMLLLD